jgi:hypothetical protein
MSITTLSNRESYDAAGGIGPSLNITTIVLTSIAMVVVLLKVYTRTVLLRFMGSDDWCILAATVRGLRRVKIAQVTDWYRSQELG